MKRFLDMHNQDLSRHQTENVMEYTMMAAYNRLLEDSLRTLEWIRQLVSARSGPRFGIFGGSGNKHLLCATFPQKEIRATVQ